MHKSAAVSQELALPLPSPWNASQYSPDPWNETDVMAALAAGADVHASCNFIHTYD